MSDAYAPSQSQPQAAREPTNESARVAVSSNHTAAPVGSVPWDGYKLPANILQPPLPAAAAAHFQEERKPAADSTKATHGHAPLELTDHRRVARAPTISAR